MGSICPRFPKRKLQQPTIQLIASPEYRPHETFISFKLYHPKMVLDSQGVILTYLGNYISLIEHPLIKSLKLKKVQCLKDTYHLQSPQIAKVGTSYMLDNPFKELHVDGFILANYPLWAQERRDEQLYHLLEQSLLISESFQQRSITLAYFQQQLGIPLNVGVRVMIGTMLQKHRLKGVKYTILFEDQKSMDYCLKYASEFTGAVSNASVTTEY